MYKVRFLQRDMITEQVLPAGMSVTVAERTMHVYGGPKSCQLEIRGNEKAFPELLDWLRNRIEIFDESGVPVWWGIVERVEVPVEKVKLVADINEMANAVRGVYTLTNSSGQSTGQAMHTDWVVDAESIEKYGRKELLLPIGESNALAADVQARIELRERAFPGIYPDGGSSEKAVAVIQGIGEWETLGWQYANVPTKLALSYQTLGNGQSYNLTLPEIKVAQSFRAATDFRLSEISLYLAKLGGPGDLTVEVCEFVDESTPGEILTSATIAAEQVGAGFSWVSAFLGDELSVIAGKRYFLVISCQWCDISSFHKIALDPNKGYPGGSFRIGSNAGWTEHTADMPFRLNQNQQFDGHSAVSAMTQRLDGMTGNFAQQFAINAPRTIAEAGIYVRKVGNPGQLSVTLRKDGSGNPDLQLATGTINAWEVGSSMAWKRVLFDRAVQVTTGSYWLDLSAKQADGSNFYEFQVDSRQTYHGGVAKKKPAGSWIDSGADMPFRTWQNTLLASYSTMTGAVLRLGGETSGLAQSFRIGASRNASRIQIFVRKVGNPGDLTVGISASLGGGMLGSGVIAAGSIGGGWTWKAVEVSGYPMLAGYSQFFLEIFAGFGDASNYYELQIDEYGSYPGESAWIKSSGTWASANADLPFSVWGVMAGVSWGGSPNASQKIDGSFGAVAQQIQTTVGSEIVRLELQVKKTGQPGNLSLGLYADANGIPGALLASLSVDASRIGSQFGWFGDWLSRQVAIGPGNHYWIKASANNVDGSNYFDLGVDTGAGYAGGVLKLEQSGNWTAVAADFPFQVFEPVIAHNFETTGTLVGRLGVDWTIMAMKIAPPATVNLSSVGLFLSKVGNPGALEVKIAKDGGNAPGEVIAKTTIPAWQVGGASVWLVGLLDKAIALEPPSSIWLVLSALGTNESNFYQFALDEAGGYSPGALQYKSGDAWAEGGGDMPFRLFSNDMVETSQQIQNLLTAYGQFFTAVFVEPSSGILMESYRGGTTDALAEIEKMLEIGNLDFLRLLARVNFDRSVEILVQPPESLMPWIEMKRDGLLWYRTGAKVEPGFNPVGKWMSIEDLLRSAQFTNVITGSQQVFLEAAKWDEEGNLETTPANWENPYAKKVKMTDG